MRFAASPLMVAVALGLLGPSVLEAEDEIPEDHATPGSSSAADNHDSELPERDR